jgi:hypothetical protein
MLRASFDGAWQQFAADHWADELGGAEYVRVHGAWLLAGQPRPAVLFILRELTLLRDSRTDTSGKVSP